MEVSVQECFCEMDGALIGVVRRCAAIEDAEAQDACDHLGQEHLEPDGQPPDTCSMEAVRLRMGLQCAGWPCASGVIGQPLTCCLQLVTF